MVLSHVSQENLTIVNVPSFKEYHGSQESDHLKLMTVKTVRELSLEAYICLILR
jgi:hypothetical protein